MPNLSIPENECSIVINYYILPHVWKVVSDKFEYFDIARFTPIMI